MVGVDVRRVTYCRVLWDGVISDERHAVEITHSFDNIYAEATVHCPLTVPPGVGVNTKVEIDGGGTFATSVRRFTGHVTGFDENLYPTGITLKCDGKMVKAKNTKPKQVGGHSLVGMTAHDAIVFMLTESGIDPADMEIDADPTLLGSTVTDPTKDTRFLWTPKMDAARMIALIDAAGDGFRTHDTPDGKVKREKVSRKPKNTADFTFTEGVDMYTAQVHVVRPWPPDQNTSTGPKDKSFTTNSVSTEVPPASNPSSDTFHSPLIESTLDSEGVGLSAETSSRFRDSQKNKNELTITLVTHRDDVILTGKTVEYSATTRTETHVKATVQTVRLSWDQEGHFEQQLDLIGPLDHRKPTFTPCDIAANFTISAVVRERSIVDDAYTNIYEVTCIDTSTSSQTITQKTWSALGGTPAAGVGDHFVTTYGTLPALHSISLTVTDSNSCTAQVTKAVTLPAAPATKGVPMFAASDDGSGVFEAFDGTAWNVYNANGPYICVGNGPVAGSGVALAIPPP